mmetsp:Transcript_10205/g.16713  ORF Transcript_10205/g.16713 Transcript_10205/m.16713 type:complete len:386 (-) Transcript_10205:590-1747(-)|eukprot:CAMPEP_0184653668 /NCGR_PEP_ID=MMETSP0308-20130426/11392_1 /TAXON_ID=38269 /ORGANISM="Gloeochaete witrockiana, Strain SAG 46.84" /LENGTH=385 /DNA_ID=CAMNT_0027089265 /DNA_START=986 /DNA_END=2143 /DNA_ORIENTATION=-
MVSTFVSDIHKALLDKEFTDVMFVVGKAKQPFNAHKIIVSARCSFFKSLLSPALPTSEGNSNEIALPEDSPAAFKVLLNYIYSDGIDWQTTPLQMAAEAAQLSDKYLLPHMKELIGEGLSKSYAENSAKVKSAFSTLPIQVLLAAISSIKEDSRVTAINKVDMVLYWLDKNEQNGDMPKLDDAVDVMKLPIKYIMDVVEPKGLLSNQSLLRVYRKAVPKYLCQLRWEPVPASLDWSLDSEQKTVASFVTTSAWNTLLAKESFTSGRYRWVIKVLRMGHTGLFIVGVAAPDEIRINKHVEWGYVSNGNILQGSATVSRGYGTGSCIHISLDCDTHTVKFAVADSIEQPPTQTGICSNLPSEVFPAISMADLGAAELIEFEEEPKAT